LFASSGYASHFRAGEITYEWVGTTGVYKYEFTITTYSNTCFTQTDDCWETLYVGEYDQNLNPIFIVLPRVNGNTYLLCPNETPPIPDGDTLAPCIKKNIYKGTYTFQYPGWKTVYMESYARNSGIVNIPNSGQSAFYLESRINVGAFVIPPNSSVQLTVDPIDEACFYQCFTHNAGAYDPDGDRLTYELTTCKGAGGLTLPFYYIPSGTVIDTVTGDVTWCSPIPNPNFTIPQEFNFAFIIHEWRKFGNAWVEVGSVMRDFQVTVDNCNNVPPQIAAIDDTCTAANQLLTFNISSSDPDNDMLSMYGLGGTFLFNPDSSELTTPIQPQNSPASATFSWTPSCDRVRSQPYQVLIKSIDNDSPVALATYKNIFVYVHAPPVLNLSATSQCNDITVTWDTETCTPQSNPLLGYKIYRKSDCIPWIHGVCETGAPPSSGYTYVGTSNTTSFTNINLSYGINYSYIVVAYYTDGAESYASAQVCVSLKKEVPIITNVDITSTNTSTGTLDLRWVNPTTGAAGLDTNAYPPPYRYDIFRRNTYTGPNQFAGSINASAFYLLTQNVFADVGLNTADSMYCYRIDFYSGTTLICSSTSASSVYLSTAPSDNAVTLSWNFNTPWVNYQYDVYRFNGTAFVMIGTTTNTTYVDDSLANGVQKCYKIKAYGQYSDVTLPSPLINWSEEKCETPVDLEPPCAPCMNIVSDCEMSSNTLTWNNPNLSCANDVIAYNIYHTPILNGDFILIATITDATVTTYVHDSLSSIAGCYYVSAIDSFNNESAVCSEQCVDNCPVYELPNVFTPNGDGVNDFFIPFPYRYVQDVDLQIFNRWGDLVFSTTNADINWDGTHQKSNQPLSDGVYYYVCVVHEIHLEGIEPRTLTGFVHILKEK